MTSAKQLLQAFDELLEPQRFDDYGPNGLQVEGKDEVTRIVAARLGLEHRFIDIDNPA